MISYIERTYFNDLLNRGGYVLDFSTYGFDEFTLHSVGIALCETYNLSKGKSLNEFNTHLREYEANYKMIGYAIERHFGLPEFCDEVYNYLSNPKAYLYYDDRITLVDILKVNFKTPQYAITELTDNQCHGTIYLTGKCLVKYINSTDIHAFDIDESVSQDLLINGKIRFHTSVPFEIEYHRKEYNDNDVATNWLIDNFIINWSDLQIKLSQNDIHAISIDLEGSINLL